MYVHVSLKKTKHNLLKDVNILLLRDSDTIHIDLAVINSNDSTVQYNC